jgi:hypothetical protein
MKYHTSLHYADNPLFSVVFYWLDQNFDGG